MDKPEALRLADEIDTEELSMDRVEKWVEEAAAELRRLSAVEAQRKPLTEEVAALIAQRNALRAELKEATEAINDPAVNNLRTLPESIRVLCARRDALLEALKKAEENGGATVYANEGDEYGERGCCGVVSYMPHADDCWVTMARAVIKAVEEGK